MTEAPGHTDLMISPEALDAFLAENPPPPPQECGECGRNGEDFAACPRDDCPANPR
jgi:hypothetical protein